MSELLDYLAAYDPATDGPETVLSAPVTAKQSAWAPKEPKQVMDALSAVYDRAYLDGEAGTYDNRYSTGDA